MRNRLTAFSFLALAVAVVSAMPAAAQTTQRSTADPATLRVLSFNVRFMNEKDGGGADGWSARRDLFFEALTKGGADLIGLQEVVRAQAEEIRAKLSGYDFVGVGRDDGKHKGEYSPVLFKRDRFEKRGEGHFWLSETPDVVGSKGWDAHLPRLASWVKLADRKNGNREFLFLNTHFDHRGQTARVESAKLLHAKATELAGSGRLPVIITGDFNATEDGGAYRALVNPARNDALKLVDAYRAAHPQRSPEESTFSAWKGVREGSRIDWILHTRHLQTLDAEIDRMNKDGRYPSDHYPVCATLKWAEAK